MPRPLSGSSADRAIEQAHSRGHVTALERSEARRAEASPGVLGQTLRTPIGFAELGPQPIRPLEVVADELVELGEIRRLVSSRSA